MADKKKAEPAKKEKAPEQKPTKAQKNVRLPILWEVVNTFSRLTVTLLGLATAVISYLNGSNLIVSVLRAGAAMLSVGLVLWFIYWMVARGSLDLMHDLYAESKKQKDNQAGARTTVSFNG
jgi:hypothetical protein